MRELFLHLLACSWWLAVPLCFSCAISMYLGEAFTPCHPRCFTLLSEWFQRVLFWWRRCKTLQLLHEKKKKKYDCCLLVSPFFFAMFYFKLVHFDLLYRRSLGASLFFCLTQNFPQSAVMFSVSVLQNTNHNFSRFSLFLGKRRKKLGCTRGYR